jgi:hypothetical protein
MAMRNGRAGAYEFTVTIEAPNELFEPRPADVRAGLPPRAPAVEEIRDELSASALSSAASVTIELPEAEATPGIERAIERAIVRYCETGIARAELELNAIRRDGLRTLIFGAVVLAVGLALSEAVLRSAIPKELRDFLGNGLFLVVAWVGLWYPLDTLIYSGRPYRFERKLLGVMREMKITVRPTDEGGEPQTDAIAADQSLTGG